jgi:putative aldouronate transport system permease protein
VEIISTKRSKGEFRKAFMKQKYLQLFALLGMLFLLIFNITPMFGLIMAFKKYDISMGISGIFTSNWCGFKYFTEFFTDYEFLPLVKNTIAISVLKLIFTFPVPICFAIVLNEIGNRHFKKIVQTVSYLPNFISWVIVAEICLTFLSADNNGIINVILMKLHLVSQPVNFLTDPNLFYGLTVVTSMWKEMGWWSIIFLAALSGIDPQQYEAAELDGVTRLNKIWYITLPNIKPTIIVVLILSLGNLLGGGLGGSNFEQCYLLGNSMNSDASQIIQTYTFKIGLSYGRYAYATAVGMIQSVISLFLVLTSNWAAKKITGNGLF